MALACHNARVVKKFQVNGSYWLVMLEIEGVFEFNAGQYVSLKVDESGIRRSYSIASRPSGGHLELLVDVTPMGVGSKFILGLKEGDVVEALCPMGVFVVKESGFKKLYIATGSGIAPMRSMVENQLINHQVGLEMKLIWGMRHEEDVFWVDEFRKLENDFANFKFELVLSQPGEDWTGNKGHVGDVLGKVVSEGMILSEYEAYICGNQKMIVETAALLYSKGMPKEQINFEKFY